MDMEYELKSQEIRILRKLHRSQQRRTMASTLKQKHDRAARQHDRFLIIDAALRIARFESRAMNLVRGFFSGKDYYQIEEKLRDQTMSPLECVIDYSIDKLSFESLKHFAQWVGALEEEAVTEVKDAVEALAIAAPEENNALALPSPDATA